MRHAVAIALVTALLVSLALPVWAAACGEMSRVPICHRTVTHHHSDQTAHKNHSAPHCEMMAPQQEEAPAPDSEQAVSDLSGKCPMQCCMQATAPNVAATSRNNLVFQPAVSDAQIEVRHIVFVIRGFSSHTDRGPPIA